ncbi:MAG: hypothetical protein PHC85_01670 [Candidatus Pacebacteria bacterium]|nr:hypothetical protein [Candidatus Paceibacterota bacterium]
MALIKKFSPLFVFFPVLLVFFACFPFGVSASSLVFSPSSGTFTAGSVFDVSVFLDTEDESVNAVSVLIKFPPEKIQLVSPTTGQSIIDMWVSQPKFNNQTGIIELKGGMPGGMNVQKGLITKLSFRVKSIGSAALKFLDESQVLLNDGMGTESLKHAGNAFFSFVLPPPAGPLVVSSTHPEQTRWYSNPTAVLNWGSGEKVDGYSYVLNNDLISDSDGISEGKNETVVYKDLENGRHYFHIKSLRNGAWGGLTHFVVNIDNEIPASFPVEISPSSKTSNLQPIIKFGTTDEFSGIDHYELKLIDLNPSADNSDSCGEGCSSFFIETGSPYIPPALNLGKYDLIIRAFDKAGNYREVVQRLEIINPLFRFVDERGFEIRGVITIPWFLFWIIVVAFLAVLYLSAISLGRKRKMIEEKNGVNRLPGTVKEKLKELRKYKERYGKIMVIVGLFLCSAVFAEANVSVNPPIITTVTRNISNEEIFYIGGKTETVGGEVIIYLQNLQTGETLGKSVSPNGRGDWFYTHTDFLPTGSYLLWVQNRIGEEMSPPSPQVNLVVRETALQMGSSRISFETFYFIGMAGSILIIVFLIAYIIFHVLRLRKAHLKIIAETKEAEEAVRRGFAILRKDIQSELSMLKEIHMGKSLSLEAKEKEEQLLSDLNEVEKNIGKEVFDIEKAEYED